MKSIRKIIRETLEKFFEMYETGHFKDRTYDRLESEYTTFKDEVEDVKQKVYDAINFLRKVNINTQDNIGIILLRGNKKYLYKRDNEEPSEGQYVWAVVRGNELETIVFGDKNYKPRNTQIHLKIEQLYEYVNDTGKTELAEKDIRKILLGSKSQQKTEPIEKEVVFMINGVRWIVDKKSEKILKKNNQSVSYDVWNVLDDKVEGLSVPVIVKDQIINYIFKSDSDLSQ